MQEFRIEVFWGGLWAIAGLLVLEDSGQSLSGLLLEALNPETI